MQPGHSSRERLEAAQALFEQKHYAEARELLRTIDNVMALDLLDKIDAADPLITPAPLPGEQRASLVISAAIVVVVVLIGVIVYTQRQRIPFIVALFASPTPTPTNTATPTNTPTSTPTFTLTFTPTDTDTPTSTFTPTNTKTPTSTFTLIPTKTNTPTPTPRPSKGRWVRRSNTASDPNPFTLVELEPDVPVVVASKATFPSLLVRCEANYLDVFVFTDVKAKQEPGQTDVASATVQFDSEPSYTTLMDISTTGDALFFRQSHSMVLQLENHDTMTFGFTPVNAPSVEATFTLQGFSEAVKPILSACGS